MYAESGGVTSYPDGTKGPMSKPPMPPTMFHHGVNDGFGGAPEPAFCRHCGVHTVFHLVDSITLMPRYYAGTPGEETKDVVMQQVKQCTYCNGSTVVRFSFRKFDPQARNPGGLAVVVYPAQKPRQADQEVPETIRDLYEEAARCEINNAPRGAAVLYRAAVEEMCKHLGVTGNNLYQRIEALAGLGLDAGVVRDMHEARLLGNDAIHDGLVYSSDEIADVAELIEEAFFVLFVQPAQRESFRERRRRRREGAQPDTT